MNEERKESGADENTNFSRLVGEQAAQAQSTAIHHKERLVRIGHVRADRLVRYGSHTPRRSIGSMGGQALSQQLFVDSHAASRWSSGRLFQRLAVGQIGIRCDAKGRK